MLSQFRLLQFNVVQMWSEPASPTAQLARPNSEAMQNEWHS